MYASDFKAQLNRQKLSKADGAISFSGWNEGSISPCRDAAQSLSGISYRTKNIKIIYVYIYI